jgi:adenylate kinase
VARADDTPQAVQGRLRDYHVKTQPVLDLFRAKEVIVAVDATGPVAQSQEAICAQLGGSRRCPPDRCPGPAAEP